MTQTFDLSKLQRRKPDMRNIAQPRFLFPGWKLCWLRASLLNELKEQDFNNGNIDRKDVVIKLPRSDKYELNLTWSDDPKNRGWVLTGPRIGKHWGKDLVVWEQRDVTFEDLVRGTEAYIMRCISNDRTGELLLANQDSRGYTYVSTTLAAWRSQESDY
jgi:hypothetical protein